MTASYNTKTKTAHVHHVQGAALAVWRATIREAAKATGVVQSPLPISVTIVFGMQRPKAHLELRRGRYVVKMQHYYDLPAVAPDLDKLVRAVLDALTGICFRDDAQVVEINARKVYLDETYIEVTDARDDSPQQTLALGMGEVEIAGSHSG